VVKYWIVGIAIFILIALSTMKIEETIIYDCTYAEISPDVPQDVKQKCREHRLLNKQQNKLQGIKT
jgi:hypothetical protein